MSYYLIFDYNQVFIKNSYGQSIEIDSSDMTLKNIDLFKQQLSHLVDFILNNEFNDDQESFEKQYQEVEIKVLDCLEQIKLMIKGIYFNDTRFKTYRNQLNWSRISNITNHLSELESICFSYTQNTDYQYGLEIMANTLQLSKIQHIQIYECDTGLTDSELYQIEKLIPKDSLKSFKLTTQRSEHINYSLESLISKLQLQKDLKSLYLSLVSLYDLDVSILEPISQFENLTYLNISLIHCFKEHSVILDLFEQLTNLDKLRSFDVDLWNNELDESQQNQIQRMIIKKMQRLVNFSFISGHQ